MKSELSKDFIVYDFGFPRQMLRFPPCGVGCTKSVWLDPADCGFDCGFGDCAKGLGGVVSVPVQVDPADAVGGAFKGEGRDGGICSEGAAGEAFAGGGAVGEDLATA